MGKRKEKKNSLSKYVEKYNKLETKDNIQNTLLKGLVDIVGIATGTGLGAIAGKNSKFVGLGAILSGHFLGDKTNVLRVIGASTLSYGIAKAKDFESNPKMEHTQERLADLKDNWFATLYIKMNQEKSKSNTNDSEVTIEGVKPDKPTKKDTTLENLKSKPIKSASKDVDLDSDPDFNKLELMEDDILQSAIHFQDERDSNPKDNEDLDKLDNPDFSLM